MTKIFSRCFADEVFGLQAVELEVESHQEHQIVNVESLWEALLQYSENPDLLRTRNRHSEAVSAINNSRTVETDERLLPDRNDGSLEGYVSRVESVVGSDEWSVAYFGLYAASPALWDAAKWFATELSRSLGKSPAGRIDIDCFVGRYSSTHTGVHVDYAHNFAFTVSPGKTMYTWPPSHRNLLGKKYPNYDEWKTDGTPLVNAPGIVAYFPPDALHVAESQGAVSVVVNVTFWEEAELGSFARDLVQEATSTRVVRDLPLTRIGAVALNPHDANNLNAVSALVRNGSAERAAMLRQLKSDTSARTGVARPPVEVTDDDLERDAVRNPIATVQWAVTSDRRDVLIGVNGHVTSLSHSPDIEQFLEAVLSEQHVDRGTVDRFFQKSAQREVLSSLYYRLWQWGAIGGP